MIIHIQLRLKKILTTSMNLFRDGTGDARRTSRNGVIKHAVIGFSTDLPFSRPSARVARRASYDVAFLLRSMLFPPGGLQSHLPLRPLSCA